MVHGGDLILIQTDKLEPQKCSVRNKAYVTENQFELGVKIRSKISV